MQNAAAEWATVSEINNNIKTCVALSIVTASLAFSYSLETSLDPKKPQQVQRENSRSGLYVVAFGKPGLIYQPIRGTGLNNTPSGCLIWTWSLKVTGAVQRSSGSRVKLRWMKRLEPVEDNGGVWPLSLSLKHLWSTFIKTAFCAPPQASCTHIQTLRQWPHKHANDRSFLGTFSRPIKFSHAKRVPGILVTCTLTHVHTQL